MKLTIGTYNIRLGIQEGVDAIADVVSPYDVDVLAVQEIGDHWTMGPEGRSTIALAERLGLEGRFVPALVEGRARYGTALFSRYPMKGFDIYPLYEEFDEPRRLARMVLEIEDEPLVFYATHLSHIEDRELQWDTVLDFVLGEEGPTFLLGDLNEKPDHWAIAELKRELNDCDPSDESTFPADDPTRRIDYVFASHGAFERTTIDENSTASDHRFVASVWTL